jgi:hypothetical protein
VEWPSWKEFPTLLPTIISPSMMLKSTIPALQMRMSMKFSTSAFVILQPAISTLLVLKSWTSTILKVITYLLNLNKEIIRLNWCLIVCISRVDCYRIFLVSTSICKNNWDCSIFFQLELESSYLLSETGGNGLQNIFKLLVAFCFCLSPIFLISFNSFLQCSQILG